MASHIVQPRNTPATDPVSVPVLSVRALTKRFPGIVANDAISLDVNAGEIHALLGENGAGKSTLISMIAGMSLPDEGDIYVAGQSVRIRSPRQARDLGIGTVFQHVLLVPSLSVIENLMLGGAWYRKLARSVALARFTELSLLLGISLDPHVPLSALSLGQQQQVEIMRALWGAARLLILDEPTSMLTPQGVKDLGAMLRRLRDNGVAIVLVTHKLAEAYDLGNRISVLRQGQVVGSISPLERQSLTEVQMTDRVIAMMFNASNIDEQTISAGRNAGHDHRVTREGAPCLQVTHASTAHISKVDERGASALQDVSFNLWPGEILGIAGIDGNGQKHLAEILSGQRKVSQGRILLDGMDVTQDDVLLRRRAGIRYVTDDRLGEGTIGSFSVALNLLLKDIGAAPFWRHGIVNRARIDAEARARIAKYDIRTRSPETPLGKLSGGNTQKVLLARELEDDSNSKIVIFAKPTHGLDQHNTRRARNRIRESAEAGQGVVLLSTDLDELLNLSNRIVVLLQGKIVGIVDNGPDAGILVGRLMTGAVT